MKKYILPLLFIAVAFSCRQTSTDPDRKSALESLLIGTFKAVQVKENGEIVYRETSTTNIIPGYELYRIEFKGETVENATVKLTEYTGETFSGKWEVKATNSENYKLIISELSPEPTGSDGKIEFQIISWNSNELVLKTQRSSPKTGDSINEYKLRKL